MAQRRKWNSLLRTSVYPGITQLISLGLFTDVSDLLETSFVLRSFEVRSVLEADLVAIPRVAQDGILGHVFSAREAHKRERLYVDEPHRDASGGESGCRPIGAEGFARSARNANACGSATVRPKHRE